MENTPQKVSTNPTPKARFQATKGNITAHHDLMENPAFDRAVDFATLEYILNLSKEVKDTASAMAVGFKLQAIVEFQKELNNLAETPMNPPARKDLDNLPTIPFPKR